VNYYWLNECFRLKTRVSENSFVIAETDRLASEMRKPYACISLQARATERETKVIVEPIETSMTQQETSYLDRPASRSRIMQDMVFTLSIPDESTRQDVQTDLESLGAVVIDQYSQRCTHVMCQYEDELAERAYKDSKEVVNTIWLDHCIGTNRPTLNIYSTQKKNDCCVHQPEHSFVP